MSKGTGQRDRTDVYICVCVWNVNLILVTTTQTGVATKDNGRQRGPEWLGFLKSVDRFT